VVKGTDKEYPAKAITEKIISSAMEVHSAFGPGLLESVSESALEHEFQLRGVPYQRQKEIGLQYKGKEIGNHRVDYLVEDQVVVELKAVDTLNRIHEAQLLTYLKVLDKRVGLLINFNVEHLRDGIKRSTV
jgi:GxxExxY protein